jgi:hypothetical protein
VTPEGGESRLTKALKSYHLSKARTASDLPSWLFSEDEGRVTRSAFTAREDDRYEEAEARLPRQRGLKAIYADAEAKSSMSNPTPAPSYLRERTGRSRFDRFDEPEEQYDIQVTYQSKATSRLQAMRDARQPNGREQQSSVRHVVEQDIDTRGDSAMFEPPQQELPQRRVGLPSGPKRRYA